MGITAAEPIERFRTKFSIDDGGCWVWTAARFQNGYGAFRVGERQMRAHRWSYEHHVGPIPQGLLVCHRCDVRACVNPAHLFLGTQKDNIADMTQKGRAPDRRPGERSNFARLTEAEVRMIRERYAAGGVRQVDLAKEFGVTQVGISKIIRRKNWAHLDIPTQEPSG